MATVEIAKHDKNAAAAQDDDNDDGVGNDDDDGDDNDGVNKNWTKISRTDEYLPWTHFWLFSTKSGVLTFSAAIFSLFVNRAPWDSNQ